MNFFLLWLSLKQTDRDHEVERIRKHLAGLRSVW